MIDEEGKPVTKHTTYRGQPDNMLHNYIHMTDSIIELVDFDI
jgi:hypothetical protein